MGRIGLVGHIGHMGHMGLIGRMSGRDVRSKGGFVISHLLSVIVLPPNEHSENPGVLSPITR